MTQPLPITIACPQCGTQIAPGLLACPVCRRLVYAQRLTELAAQAHSAAQRHDTAEAIRLWREALELLPPDSRQYAAISDKVTTLTRHAPAAMPPSPARPASPRGGRLAAGATGAALLLWKFKFILAFILTKGKLLLLGLTKGSTFLTMFLSFAVYWSAWGWAFAAGLVISIYIHEMGHVEALRRYGFRATAPMFIPGLGAVIRLKQHPVNPGEDARIGLAGPLWGLGAALVAFLVFLWTRKPIWGAIAHVGAWINLFNLLPIWQLDGGRGFRPLSRQQAWALVALAGVGWFLTAEGLLLLLLLIGVFQTLAKPAHQQGDRNAMLIYGFLIIALSLLSRVHVPMGAR